MNGSNSRRYHGLNTGCAARCVRDADRSEPLFMACPLLRITPCDAADQAVCATDIHRGAPRLLAPGPPGLTPGPAIAPSQRPSPEVWCPMRAEVPSHARDHKEASLGCPSPR